MKIKLGKAYNKGEIFPAGILEIKDGKFAGVCEGEADIDVSQYITFPGFIDMHTHGGAGLDANMASEEELDAMSRFYAEAGVCEFCATTVTSSVDDLVEIEKRVTSRIEKGTSGAHIAGIYLEGPYLCHEFRGAHEETLLAVPNNNDIKRLIDAGKGNLRIIAIAPETEGALDAISFAAENGIKVSCGHSAATAAQANAGFSAGATVAVHMYNAMRGLHHREAGMLGASLINDNVYGELICDFIHVSPEAARLAIRAKGKDRIIYITDSIAAAGLPDGEHMSGPLPITVKNSVARTHEGALAGSSLRTNIALKNVVKTLGIPLEEAMLGVTKNPAEAMGLYGEIGSIDIGKRANLTVLDRDFNVVMTIVNGKIVYRGDL